MALRTIVQDGDPILKKKCRPVTNFDDRLAELLDDMIETLADAQGNRTISDSALSFSAFGLVCESRFLLGWSSGFNISV